MLTGNDDTAPGGPEGTGVTERASSVTQKITTNVTPATQEPPQVTPGAERQRRWRKKHPGRHNMAQRRAYHRRKQHDEEVQMAQMTVADEVIYFEGLTKEAQALAKKAGLTVADWLDRMPETDRRKWDGVLEVLAVWDRVAREIRERDAWLRSLVRDPRRRGAVFCYDFLRFAERQIRGAGIKLDEQQAVDYFFDILLPEHKDTGNGQVWHANFKLDPLEQNVAKEEQERARRQASDTDA